MHTSVVGIGASAGGLEAFKPLLARLPADTGLAFVFIQHLHPTHHSDLVKILAGVGSLPVREAGDGMEIAPNELYVIPPDRALEIVNDVLRITPRAPVHSGPHMPINQFLQSLAAACGNRAIGVLLSGAGTDGAAGLEAVKAAGGVTFAQDPATAGFDSMPRAAIEMQCVDFIMSPEDVAAELTKLAHGPYVTNGEGAGPPGAVRTSELSLDPLFAILRDGTGIDFALYRQTTVRRRIARRMALCHSGSLAEYCEYVRRNPGELSALHRDLLINVTSFFRDPETFENLKKVVFPRLVRGRPPDAAIRIWVAGCASGEEPYSIAISLQEYFRETGRAYPVQIFASDISATAINRARTGEYNQRIADDVGTEILSRYFSKIEGGYRINTTLREMCVFSRHNLLYDPPFSKLDLISCLNTLIFFGDARQSVVGRFHYALNAGGYLVLGPSKTESDSMFSAIDGAGGVYEKVESPVSRPSSVPFSDLRRGTAHGTGAGDRTEGSDLRKELERALLSRYRGAAIVVDRNLEVLEIIGQASRYIALPSGIVNLSLLNLISDTGLFLKIEKLVREAETSGKTSQRARIPDQGNPTPGELNLEVIPLGAAGSRAFLVLFDQAPVAHASAEANTDPKDREIARLKQDLADMRQRFLTIVEEHQHSDRESQSTAYDALSANEELQSLNEELETAKEELQSINEELTTVNQELQVKNAALSEASDFAMSIIEGAATPILVLDGELRIEAASDSFYRMFGLSADEAKGRSLYSVSKSSCDIPRLREVLERILPDQKTIHGLEIEHTFPGVGRRVLLVTARQLDDVQRVVVGIEDVTDIKGRADARLRESEERFANLADAAPVMIWVAGLDKGCTFFNKPWLEFTGRTLQQELGNGWAEGVHPEDLDRCWKIYSSSFDARHTFRMEYRLRQADGEYRWILDNGIPRFDAMGVFEGYIGSCVDITELKKEQEDLARQKLETVGLLAEGIVHDFNNLMGGILACSELALEDLAQGADPSDELQRIRAAGLRGAEIARQLMVYAGRESEVLEAVNVSAIVEDILDLLKVSISKHARIETDLPRDLPTIRATPSQIRQVLMNLISNASEAIGNRDGTIRIATTKVTLSPESSSAIPQLCGEYIRLEVADTGRGMTADLQARIFDPFFTTKLTGSHGHGLPVVHRLVQRLNGAVEVSSVPEQGTTFTVYLPAEASAPQSVTPIANSLQFSPPTILFVEDEEQLRQAISKILRTHGYTVIEASDGSAALDAMRAHKNEIDLLILDITLPGASSRQVHEEARRLRPDLPVIVTSAKSEEMAAAMLSTGVESFLRKPFLSLDLIDRIRRMIRPVPQKANPVPPVSSGAAGS